MATKNTVSTEAENKTDEVKEAENNEPAGKKTPKATPKPAPSKCGFCVYLGPTVRAEITSGMIIPIPKDEALEQYKDIADKFPEIVSLIVPGGELSSARQKIQTPGSYLKNQYDKLAGELTGGKF